MNALMVIMGILGSIGTILFLMMLRDVFCWNGCLTGVLGFFLIGGYVVGIVASIQRVWDLGLDIFTYWDSSSTVICIVIPVGIILGIIAIVIQVRSGNWGSDSYSSSSSSSGKDYKCGSCRYFDSGRRRCWNRDGNNLHLDEEHRKRMATDSCYFYHYEKEPLQGNANST